MTKPLGDIAAALADDKATHAERARAICAVRNKTLRDCAKADLPLVIPLKDGELKIVACDTAAKGGVALTCELTRNSVTAPINNPWVIVNPPLKTADGTYDPLGALAEIARQKFNG